MESRGEEEEEEKIEVEEEDPRAIQRPIEPYQSVSQRLRSYNGITWRRRRRRRRRRKRRSLKLQ